MDIKDIYKGISQLNDLKPSEQVNSFFSELVSKAIKYNADGKLTNYEQSVLQNLAAKAEFELEMYWAKEIINSEKPQTKLKAFPYYKNYSDLTKLELYSLQSCIEHKDHKVVFVGGGPLPMTAIMLAIEHNIDSTIIDCDETAVEQAKKLLMALNLDNKIRVEFADGVNYDYSNHNTIYIAALAGLNNKIKNQIFKQIKSTSQKGTHLIARSSWRNRKLLYKPISTSIYKIFQPIIKVDPFNDIVNSIIILKNA